MKDKSALEEIIRYCEREISMREFLFPILMLFPCIAAFICFLLSQIWLGIGLVAFVIAMIFLMYFLNKGAKEYITKMKKELEDLKYNKK